MTTMKRVLKAQMDQKILMKRAIRMKKGLKKMPKRAKMTKKETGTLRRRNKTRLAKMGQVPINKEQNMRFQPTLIRMTPKPTIWQTLRA